MSTTPRTDALLQDAGNDPYETGWIEHARQLETELAAVTAERDALKSVVEKVTELMGGLITHLKAMKGKQ
jgi:hypothetical protein